MKSMAESEPQDIGLRLDAGVAIRARFLVLELMLDMLWTDRLARLPDTQESARSFKRETLGRVAILLDDREEDRLLHDTALKLLQQRFDAIIDRVDSLTPSDQQQQRRAGGGFG